MDIKEAIDQLKELRADRESFLTEDEPDSEFAKDIEAIDTVIAVINDFHEKPDELRAIMEHYGYEAQREQFVEECAEAIQAAQKCKRIHDNQGAREAFENLKEEIADVLIMAAQMYHFLGADEIDRIIAKKLDRQMRRIADESADSV